MDEDEYQATYLSLNCRVCPFEKVILSRQCDCARADRILIAERQAVGCNSDSAQQQCITLLQLLRNNANFVFRLTAMQGRLPHAKEMKVQCGGLLGLQRTLHPEHAPSLQIDDIDGLVNHAKARYGDFEHLPFAEIVKSVASYQGRRSGRQRGK